jgi:hypothetical protein
MQIPSPVELKITVIPGEAPQITGPLKDKMLCYAMLEIARDAIKDFVDQEQSMIQPVRSLTPNGSRDGGSGR